MTALFKNQRSAEQRGFTLVELLVAISIFVIVMLIGVGSLMTMLDANLKSRNQRLVFNNINVAMDSIVREVREGSEFVLDPGDTTYLQFLNVDTDTIEIYMNNGVIYRTENGGAPVALTPDTVVITTLLFDEVAFSGDINDEYDKLLLVLSGETQTGDPAVDSAFTLQTTITRDLALQSGLVLVDAENPVCILEYDVNDFYLNLEHGRSGPNAVGYPGPVDAGYEATSDRVYGYRQMLPAPRGTPPVAHDAGVATPYWHKDGWSDTTPNLVSGNPVYSGANTDYRWTQNGALSAVPAGTYDLTIQTYDWHYDTSVDPDADCLNGLAWESHDQPHERMYLQYWNGSSWEELLGTAAGVGLVEQDSALASGGYETTAGFTADVPTNACNQITVFEDITLPALSSGTPIRTVHCVPTPGNVGGSIFGGAYSADAYDACGGNAGSFVGVCATIEVPGGGFSLGGGREQ